jgi:hypothetical protein
MRSLIKRRQIDADISGAVYEYGQLLFPSFGQVDSLIKDVVYTTGNQNIQGQKTFSNRPIVDNKRVLLEGDITNNIISGTGIINLENVVYTTGDQIISGEKIFDKAIYISGKKILLEGDIVGLQNFISGSKSFFTSGVYFSGVDVVFDKDSNIILEGNSYIDTINGHTSFGIYNLFGVPFTESVDLPLGIRTGNIVNISKQNQQDLNSDFESYVMIEYDGPLIPNLVYPIIHPLYEKRALKKINWGSNSAFSNKINFESIFLSGNRNIFLTNKNNTEYDIYIYQTGDFNINLPDLNLSESGNNIKFKLSYVDPVLINKIKSGYEYKISFNGQNLLEGPDYYSLYNIYSEISNRDYFIEFKNKNSNFWTLESIPFLQYAKSEHPHEMGDIFLLEETLNYLTGYDKVNSAWFVDDFLISKTPASRNLYIDCLFDTTGACIIDLPDVSGQNAQNGDILYYNVSLNIQNPDSLSFRFKYLTGNSFSENLTLYNIQNPKIGDFAEFVFISPEWRLKNYSNQQVIESENYQNYNKLTFSGFKNLKNNNLLTEGSYYEITDFISKWWNKSSTDKTVKSGKYFEPLVVMALTKNSIAKNAFSTIYPEDIIYYDDEAKTSYTWESNNNTEINDFKGWIYRRIDTKNSIDISCDWRNLTVNCGKLDLSSVVLYSTSYNYSKDDVVKTSAGKLFISLKNSNINKSPDQNSDWWQQLTPFIEADSYFATSDELDFFNIKSNGSTNILTLPVLTGALIQQPIFSNSITNTGILNSTGVKDIYIKKLINSVFYVPSGQNINCYSNEIGSDFSNNTIDARYFYRNKIGDEFSSNIIGSGFYSNAVGDQFNSNNISKCFNNEISNSFSGNLIKGSFYKNYIGQNFNSNLLIGNFFENNIFNNFEKNVIGDNFRYNEGSFSGSNLNLAAQNAHVYSSYSVKFLKNSNNQSRLSYYNSNDQLVITDLDN